MSEVVTVQPPLPIVWLECVRLLSAACQEATSAQLMIECVFYCAMDGLPWRGHHLQLIELWTGGSRSIPKMNRAKPRSAKKPSSHSASGILPWRPCSVWCRNYIDVFTFLEVARYFTSDFLRRKHHKMTNGFEVTVFPPLLGLLFWNRISVCHSESLSFRFFSYKTVTTKNSESSNDIHVGGTQSYTTFRVPRVVLKA